jgi:hypothetical protein
MIIIITKKFGRGNVPKERKYASWGISQGLLVYALRG